MIYIDDSEPEGVLEPAFPYRDVTIKRGVDANELYDILSEVGRGKFGTVYKCQEKATGVKLAAKFVPIPKREDKRNVEREVEIMNSLQHHLIIQLYAAYEYQKMMCVVLELVEGGELFDRVVDDEFVLTERACVVFIRQLCEAMEFIHRNHILHLDLKPENILCLTQEGNRIKIIDFGLARKYDPNKRLQILFGTPEFVAPEVVNFDCISYGTDMWSVGVICYVLISGLSPFMGETDIETMANVTIAKYDFEDESFSNVSPECLDFISKLLVKDLSVRMTAAQCLEHKWLQRRSKAPPILSPKPLNVPPPKLKASTPSPIPPALDDDDEPLLAEVAEENEEEVEAEAEAEEVTKELDTTKDNLKTFIERWEEHPNSPYVFDVEGNVIAPLNEQPTPQAGRAPDSISSSRVCSPSPCGSLATITDDEETANRNGDRYTPINESPENRCHPHAATSSETTTPTPQYSSQHLFEQKGDQFHGSDWDLQKSNLRSYLHTFDRRNSDTTYLLGRRVSDERVNLAEEIRKLSDHLLMLAEINNKLGNENKREAAEEKLRTINSSGRAKESGLSKSPAKSAASSATRPKTSSTATEVVANSKTTAVSSANNSTFFNSLRTRPSSISWRLQQSLEETPTLTSGGWISKSPSTSNTNKSTVHPISTGNTKAPPTSAAPALNSNKNKHSGAGETASVRRAKFRMTQLSRDVPSDMPDKHQAVNLEEAANTTKDCLLHLLEKYNDTRCRNPLGRHQSVSVDWNVKDNLGYRSMSSINAFFQRHNNTRENVRQLQAQLEEKAAKTGGS